MDLQKIKEQYLKETYNGSGRIYSDNEVDELMRRACDATLDLAAEKARIDKYETGEVFQPVRYRVDVESILNLKNNYR